MHFSKMQKTWSFSSHWIGLLHSVNSIWRPNSCFPSLRSDHNKTLDSENINPIAKSNQPKWRSPIKRLEHNQWNADLMTKCPIQCSSAVYQVAKCVRLEFNRFAAFCSYKEWDTMVWEWMIVELDCWVELIQLASWWWWLRWIGVDYSTKSVTKEEKDEQRAANRVEFESNSILANW